ncbi:UNVERIFIED_CONTAM: Retrovirus-related Pol polyprotein from transposon TNT 1-94 [Sesamum latifolium]|uniref:Retrovirus-related Pol polyprotein from transposon TNT 1-94 n=1 Tax=Sesamum latifolium TaxID=2727402 RepID=A0AAW2U2V9_9LAMI
MCATKQDWWLKATFRKRELIDYNEVFSPVVKHSSIRILLALVAQLDFELVQLDVKTAFLHGDLEEEIYMTQPEGFDVAGKENLLQDGSFIYLLLYVDDMLIASKSRIEIEKLKTQLKREFEMKDLGEAKKILGMEITRDRGLRRLCLTQKQYLKRMLNRFGLNEKSKVVSTPLAPHFKLSASMSPKSEEEQEYMSRVSYANVVGSLMYAMENSQCVIGYCDSDFAGDMDKWRSTTGYVFTLAKAPVNWRSTLQSTVALSTTEAEYMAITEAVKEAIWLQGLLGELGIDQKHVTVHCDSQSAIQLAKNQVYNARTKHIDVRYHFVQEILEEGGVKIQKIRTTENPADMLTKVVTAIKFIFYLDLINLVKI